MSEENIKGGERYLLFAGHFYYATGGVSDLKMSSNSLDEVVDHAKHMLKCQHCDWIHIFDCSEGKIIAGTRYQAHGANDLKDHFTFRT